MEFIGHLGATMKKKAASNCATAAVRFCTRIFEESREIPRYNPAHAELPSLKAGGWVLFSDAG
jgi:hypothetical protein